MDCLSRTGSKRPSLKQQVSKLPPGPPIRPITGNATAIDLEDLEGSLHELAKNYGSLFPLKKGRKIFMSEMNVKGKIKSYEPAMVKCQRLGIRYMLQEIENGGVVNTRAFFKLIYGNVSSGIEFGSFFSGIDDASMCSSTTYWRSWAKSSL